MTGRCLLSIAAILCLSGCNAADLDIPRRSPEQQRQLDHEVREAMQRIQIGAEHYAADHGTDHYPTKIDDEFKSYMPGGQEGRVPAPVGVVNVYTGINEFPRIGSIKDVRSVRSGPRFPVNRGQIFYCPLADGKGYAIYGGAGDDKALLDEKNPEQVLLFSNFEDQP